MSSYGIRVRPQFDESRLAPYKKHVPVIHIKWSNDPHERAIQRAAYNFHTRIIARYQKPVWEPKKAKRPPK